MAILEAASGGAIENGCRTLWSLELETGSWSRQASGGRRSGGGFVADGLQEESGCTFQVGGAAGRLCACRPGVFSEKGPGWLRRQSAATTRMAPKGGRGPPAAARRAQHFKFSSGREVARAGSRPAEEQVGRSRLGACEGGRSRTHYLGWESSRPPGRGSRRCKRRCGIARGRRRHFLRLD